ncbi:hypothetical protein EV714DRAFT_286886 [Schizophyllum commune]
MEADRPVKRPRVDGDDTTSVQRSDIWFDDGNVVLQAENVQFRVHRSLLARHSPVFKDVFGVPQPKSSSEALVEGCPVVHLTDKASDVHFMLTRLFNLKRFPPIVRLRPLMYCRLLPRILGRRPFPSNLPSLLAAFDGPPPIHRSGHGRLLHLADAVAEVGLQKVLLALYYAIIYWEALETIISDAQISDRTRCILLGGRAKLLDMTVTFLKPWGTNTNPHGKNSQNSINCAIARHRFYLTTIDGQPPFNPVCRGRPEGYFDSHINLLLNGAWEQLPEVFGLSAWKDLKDFDIA